ncbi:unnamed protein product [Amaranthus hypochondriacus]
MDEDEEIKSQSDSPDSESHSPGVPQPMPLNQIAAVTVAAAAPTSAAADSVAQKSLTLALPIQQSSRLGGGGGGREDCWSEGATSVLIDAWGERYVQLSRGNLKQKHWMEVADIVNKEDPTKVPKTDIQCKNRIDTVKKKYKTEKLKIANGYGPSRWTFFERLDRLIGSAAGTLNPSFGKGLGSGFGTPSAAGVTVSPPPATVSTADPKSIPVGIPVRARQPAQLPFSPSSYLQTPRPPHQPHQELMRQIMQQQQQQQQQQQPQLSGFRYNNNSNVHNINVGDSNNLNNGRSRGMWMQQRQEQRKQVPQQEFRKIQPAMESDSDKEDWSNDSRDSLPPDRTRFQSRKRKSMELNRGDDPGGIETGKGKKRVKKSDSKVWGESVRELTKAILKFGEAYEAAESMKLQHTMEMEMQRMKFAKELELQRMKFMMKIQLELSQLNGNGNVDSDSRGGGESNHHNYHKHDNHVNNHTNSDTSN